MTVIFPLFTGATNGSPSYVSLNVSPNYKVPLLAAGWIGNGRQQPTDQAMIIYMENRWVFRVLAAEEEDVGPILAAAFLRIYTLLPNDL